MEGGYLGRTQADSAALLPCPAPFLGLHLPFQRTTQPWSRTGPWRWGAMMALQYGFASDGSGLESRLGFPMAGDGTWGKPRDLSGSQLAHLENGDITAILQGCCEAMRRGKHLTRCLAPCELLIIGTWETLRWMRGKQRRAFPSPTALPSSPDQVEPGTRPRAPPSERVGVSIQS